MFHSQIRLFSSIPSGCVKNTEVFREDYWRCEWIVYGESVDDSNTWTVLPLSRVVTRGQEEHRDFIKRDWETHSVSPHSSHAVLGTGINSHWSWPHHFFSIPQHSRHCRGLRERQLPSIHWECTATTTLDSVPKMSLVLANRRLFFKLKRIS